MKNARLLELLKNCGNNLIEASNQSDFNRIAETLSAANKYFDAILDNNQYSDTQNTMEP